jgi:multiple sugar transport system ATP-binding protein
MSQLELDHVTKRYRQSNSSEIVAVDDLSLTLDQGEFLVLVGPSGCGKSTTLNSVAGLEDITDGSIRIGGRDVTNETPEERDIAMVFQNYALYPHMSVKQNMGFGLKMTTDLSKEEISGRVEETAEMLGISELLDQKPKALSGGQRQRVALGRAIVREPEVFLMDEPLSNLDAKLRNQMRTEIQELQNQLGATTVYVTHDQTEAMTMGDRIAILNDGELQQIGTPIECYFKPANQFVAGFIGDPSMNFFEMTVDGRQLVHQTFTYELPPETVDQLETTDEVVLGIRPESIEFESDSYDNEVTATVHVVEPMGDRNVLHLEVGNKSVTATVDGTKMVAEGSQVSIAFPSNRIHIFDGKTGETLVNRSESAEHIPAAFATEGEC